MGRIKQEERVLSYHEKGRCWRKFYKGKMRYFGPKGVAKSDDASYRQAVKDWEVRKAEIDLELAEGEAQEHPTVISALKLASAMKRAGHRNEIPAAFQSLPFYVDPATLAALNVHAAMDGVSDPASRPHDKQTTVKGIVEAFISSKRALSEAGQISRQMFIEYEHNAKVFGEWAEQSGVVRPEQIDAPTLERYRDFVLRLKNPEFARKAETRPLGDVAIQKRLARLKQLIEWAWNTEQLEVLPRNLKSFAKLRNGNGQSGAEKSDGELFWTVEECREMIEAATARTRLYILLALNCGYTQSDVASLSHSHIDWETGVITRPRHKTKGKTCHKLWPITLELLKQEAEKPDKKQPSNGLVLKSTTGQPLISDSAETTTRQDTIKLAFNLLRDSLIKKRLRDSNPDLFKLATRASEGMTPAQLKAIEKEQQQRAEKIKEAIALERKNESRSFKSFRKTSANLIERKYGDGSKLADQFLGHTQKATKRFYVDSHYDQLFEAIEWLGNEYGFKS